jgi:hypothetical protein
MAEPKAIQPDPLELATDQAIATCDGDVRAALKAALVALTYSELEIERLTNLISTGYTRRRVSPARSASTKQDDWREISSGKLPDPE